MRQILVMHGIGEHTDTFHREWEGVLQSMLPDASFEVTPLFWGDLQDRIAARYPIVSPRLAAVLSRIGVGAGESFRGHSAYHVIHAYILDVVAYAMLHDMRHFIQTECLLALKQKTRGREHDTILVGHSLGAAVLTHIVQLERRITGAIPYRGLVLLAPPLGIKSPVASIPDPLAVTPDSTLPTSITSAPADDRASLLETALLGEQFADWAHARADGRFATSTEERLATLTQVCMDWGAGGDWPRLHVCVNRNDVVCSDVRFEIGDRLLDIIRIKQGFDGAEREVIETLASFHSLEFGALRLDNIEANHNVLDYLRQPAVVQAIGSLLEDDA